MSIFKKAIMIGIWLCLWTATVAAETMYVRDILYISLRTGPTNGQKVIATIPSGEPLKVIDTQKKWSRIKATDGKTGWVLTRYLVTKKPTGLLLKLLHQKHAKLIALSKVIKKKNQALKLENTSMKQKNIDNHGENTSLQKKYKDLKQASSNYLILKRNYEKEKEQFLKQKTKIIKLTKKIDELRSDRVLFWHIVGSGVFFMGLMIGIIFKGGKSTYKLR